MPSGRKDIYGAPSRRLADPKVIKAEMAVKRNADASAKVTKTTVREGTTNPSGGRPAAASKMMAPKAAPKPKPLPKPVQVIRTTTMMKPTPTKKK